MNYSSFDNNLKFFNRKFRDYELIYKLPEDLQAFYSENLTQAVDGLYQNI